MPGRERSWDTQAERGSLPLVRFMVWLTLTLGWHVGHALLYPITAYYYVSAPPARRASRAFLGRVLGRRAGRRDVFRHLFVFSCVILDRLFLVAGRLDGYRIGIFGLEHLQAAIDQGRGCVLLGAHLGSFEVLRAVAADCPVKVNPLMYHDNTGALSGLLEHMNPQLAASVIQIGTIDTMLRAREAVARGELVAILADRAPAGGKLIPTEFLGATAALPSGPMVLASLLGAPTVLFFGLRTGSRRYEVHFEPFAQAVTLRREARQQDLRHWIGLYAGKLAARCRAHPFNWFNFYDFWGSSQHGTSHKAVVDSGAGLAADGARSGSAAG